MKARVAVDCMGGDHGVSVTIPAVLSCRKKNRDVEFLLVGRPDDIRQALSTCGQVETHDLVIQPAEQIVAMDEAPYRAVKNKKKSSMRIAVNLVKEQQADVCVSAGNTGALMTTAHFVLQMIAGMKRPAIAAFLPNWYGQILMLDLGANVQASADSLMQFGLMGSCLRQLACDEERPTVGLLNMGLEEMKGHDVIKEATELLRATSLNFVGNVEGDDIYMGAVGVMVCEGFVGNLIVKSSEGLAQLFGRTLKEELSHSLFRRLSAFVAKPVFRSFLRQVDHRRYNGGYLLGLRGLVLKSHGGADFFAFECAVQKGIDAVRFGLLKHIECAIHTGCQA